MAEERKGGREEPQAREQSGQGRAPKIGEGMLRDWLAQGATELAQALGVQGHEQGMSHVYGRGR